MGKEDIDTLDFFENNTYFADIANGFLFGGKQVIEPQKLEVANKEVAYYGAQNGAKVIRDNVKKYYDNTLFCIYVLEHQKNIDYHMIIRNMLAEALEYKRQWRAKKKVHKEKKDLKTSHEILSGITREDTFAPVVTMVVYYGEDKWDAATSLHDIIDFGEEFEDLKPYVENYHIHVFDYHDYDNFEMFQTELNQIFSFLKCSKDKEDLKKLIANRQEEYYNMSNESVELIATLTNSKELLNLENGIEGDLGGKNMCKALEDLKLEGGTDKLKEQIRKKIDKGNTIAEIADALEEEESVIEQLIKEL